MLPFSLSRLQLIAYTIATIPLVVLLIDFLTGNLTVNPIQEATKRTGDFAFILLILTLACTPIYSLTGYRGVQKIRRGLGLFAFGYAMLHFFIYIGIDYWFDWEQIFNSVLEKRYILVGSTALIILTLLAVTSFRWWMVKLGKNWKFLHRLVYLAGLLVVLHVAWAVKGDLFTLQGDIWKPFVGGIIVVLLLILRIPIIRRGISKLRQRYSQPSQSKSKMPSIL